LWPLTGGITCRNYKSCSWNLSVKHEKSFFVFKMFSNFHHKIKTSANFMLNCLFLYLFSFRLPPTYFNASSTRQMNVYVHYVAKRVKYFRVLCIQMSPQFISLFFAFDCVMQRRLRHDNNEGNLWYFHFCVFLYFFFGKGSLR
jgi:hypothetical protein